MEGTPKIGWYGYLCSTEAAGSSARVLVSSDFCQRKRAQPVPAKGAQDYGCAVIAVNMTTRARRPGGMERIPSPAATFLEIGLWARDAGTVSGRSLDPQDCVLSADSPER